MQSWLKSLNFILIALFLFAIIKLWSIAPASSALPILNIFPFGLALLSSPPTSGRTFVRIAVILNLFWILLYIGALSWLVAFNRSALLTTTLLFVPVIVVAVLNCRALWRKAFPSRQS